MKKYNFSFILILLLLFLLGIVVRLAPLFDSLRLLYSITDDGYYMLTIARNIAMGNGMSISNGIVATNGTQPLFTFLLSIIYLIVNFDKISAIKFVVLLQFLISASTSYLLYKLSLAAMKDYKNGHKIALLSSAVWFCNPLMIVNTTNGLETGLYAFSVLFSVWLIVFKIQTLNYKNSIFLGIIFGVLFWIRNDAELLVIAVFIYYLFFYKDDNLKMPQIFLRLFVMGFAALLFTLPWLIFNKINFGDFIPISGQAESVVSKFGGNLIFFPSTITEYLLVIVPIPYNFKIKLFVIIFTSLFVSIIFSLLLNIYKKFYAKQKALFIICFVFLIELFIIYGLFFETYYFVSRYLFPLSTFFILLWSVIAFKLFDKIKFKLIKYVIGLIFIVIIAAISWIRFNQGLEHKHFQLVSWIQQNVKDDEWVGASQSGTIGYFHDKTVNLDGKVNPEALKALKDGGESKLLEYIAAKKIDYLMDWASLREWKNHDIIMKNYNLIVEDTVNDITVFKRK